MHDAAHYTTHWLVRRYPTEAAYRAGRPDWVRDPVTGLLLPPESPIEGNLLLNAGIAIVLDLAAALAAPTAFSAAAAELGVGDSSAAEAATQTDLQAAANKTWVGMEAGYPSRSAQTVTWRGVFGTAAANYAWAEFAVRNGTTLLNRKVSSQGTKASGQTWTLDLAITLS